MIHRQNCPSCHRSLPFFMFRADRKVSANKEEVVFVCPYCQSKLVATSNEAHQQNFLWVILVPLFALVVLISLHAAIPAYIRPIYYFLGMVLPLMAVVMRGQHMMDISLFSDKRPQDSGQDIPGESRQLPPET